MKLSSVHIKGFKSIDQKGQSISFGDITVLLGANGSGKSNLVSFFKMLNFMTTGAMQTYVGRTGVDRILFYGPKVTENISFRLLFENEEVVDSYETELSFGSPDRLFINSEKISYHKKDHDQPQSYALKSGGSEINLILDQRKTSKILLQLISRIRVFHFQDTSDTAKIKNRGYIDDATYLRSDAGNLAAFLRMMKGTQQYERYYQRIIRRIQKIMPQFVDFILDTSPDNHDYVRLNWTDQNPDSYLFGPDQISDGSLRFMALTTLLLQPPDLLPKFIVLDEPELGLHPFAIAELAGMIQTASQHAQILIATQSTRLVDEFSPEQVVIVERDNQRSSSHFKKLDFAELSEWLERYSLSELWEKNVLGAQP